MLRYKDITLRPISQDDTEFILELRNDLEIAKNFFSEPPVYDFGHSNWLKAVAIQNIEFLIEYQGKKAGKIALSNIDYRNQKAEYGVLIKNNFQGKGIAFVSSILLINFAFEHHPLQKIFLKVFEDNKPALKLYNKLGFIQEGRFERDIFKLGFWKNVLQMALFKDKWAHDNSLQE